MNEVLEMPTRTRPSASTIYAPAKRRAVVEVENLRKVFPQRAKPTGSAWRRLLPAPTGQPFVAVDGVSFDIREGEIFGLLGPNGAGKTTTIRMLSTLLEPTSGVARVNGYDIVRDANKVRQSLGAVLTGERSIYWKLSGRENLEYFAALYHLPPAVARERITMLLDRLELSHRADEYVERYSAGMKQRIAIAKALLANPPVVLLDEPTVGLDPQSARNLRELVSDIRREGRTVLLTTHYMEEADQLCDRIGIVDRGTIIALDTPANLKRSIKQLDIVRIEIANFDRERAAALAAIPEVERMAQTANEDGTIGVALHTSMSRDVLPRAIDQITRLDGQVRHLETAQPTLEDVFINLTGKKLRD